MRSLHMIGAALLSIVALIASAPVVSAVALAPIQGAHEMMDAHEMTSESSTAGEKAAPRKYGKGATQGGGGGRGRGCGC